MMQFLKSALLAIASLSLVACSSPANVDYSSGFNQLPKWHNGSQQGALVAIKKSCTTMLRQKSYKAYYPSCRAMLKLPNNISNTAMRYQISKWFRPKLVNSYGVTKGLFTGYYEPTIQGSKTVTNYYGVPIYGKPRNLVRKYGSFRLKKGSKYYRLPSRATISAGKLLKNTPILAWVHSKVDRFFLQIQGSGSILFPNGQRLLLGYAAQNGHSYYPIGKYLLQTGALTRKNVSMQSIRKWLHDNPNQVQKVLNKDPSFVFFRVVNAQNPIGAQGVPLTPGRSIAVDRYYHKLGSMFWLETTLPNGKKLNRLMVAQDTGGAIKGRVRADIFFGAGKKAAWLAGHMQATGRYWILVPV